MSRLVPKRRGRWRWRIREYEDQSDAPHTDEDDYTISDGVKFWMADEGRPVLCRVTHEALRDHADRLRLNVADEGLRSLSRAY
jgi:Protein of unknown function (DUF1488)